MHPEAAGDRPLGRDSRIRAPLPNLLCERATGQRQGRRGAVARRGAAPHAARHRRRLSLSTRTLGGAATTTAPISYRVDRLDGALPDPLATSRASPDIYVQAALSVEGR